MITNEQLNEIFKPLLDECEKAGKTVIGVSYWPTHKNKIGLQILGFTEIVQASDCNSAIVVMNEIISDQKEEIRSELLHHENKANELRAQLEAAQ